MEFLWEAGTGGARALELEGSNLSCVSQASYFTSLGLHVCLCKRRANGPQVIVGIQGHDAFGDAGTCTGSGIGSDSASGSWTGPAQPSLQAPDGAHGKYPHPSGHLRAKGDTELCGPS